MMLRECVPDGTGDPLSAMYTDHDVEKKSCMGRTARQQRTVVPTDSQNSVEEIQIRL